MDRGYEQTCEQLVGTDRFRLGTSQKILLSTKDVFYNVSDRVEDGLSQLKQIQSSLKMAIVRCEAQTCAATENALAQSFNVMAMKCQLEEIGKIIAHLMCATAIMGDSGPTIHGPFG
eukprot:8941882-Pyramimonas_sp.AAC.1